MALTNQNKSSAVNFSLVFPKLPIADELGESSALTLNIYQTVIPSLTLEVTETHWQGSKSYVYSGGLSQEPWFIHFDVDSRFGNWLSLYKWIQFIHNNKDKYGRPMDEFQVDATLFITDNFKREILVMDVIRAWPNMLGEITLSYREGEENLSSTMNLMYDRYEIRNI